MQECFSPQTVVFWWKEASSPPAENMSHPENKRDSKESSSNTPGRRKTLAWPHLAEPVLGKETGPCPFHVYAPTPWLENPANSITQDGRHLSLFCMAAHLQQDRWSGLVQVPPWLSSGSMWLQGGPGLLSDWHKLNHAKLVSSCVSSGTVVRFLNHILLDT